MTETPSDSPEKLNKSNIYVTSLDQVAEIESQGKVICLPEDIVAINERLQLLAKEQADNIDQMNMARSSSTENMGHDDAGQEMAQLAGNNTHTKATQLIKVIKNHQEVSPPPTNITEAGVGSYVWVKYPGEKESICFRVIGTLIPGLNQESAIESYSYNSPIGRAVIGRRAGETADIILPNGRSIEITVESVSQESPLAD